LPFKPNSHTEVLAAIHLPIALWLMVCYSYAGGRWRHHEQRMKYVRFSGEWFIYYTLIALGGGALMGLTSFIFEAIGLDAKSAYAYDVLGLAQANQGKMLPALQSLGQALRLAPKEKFIRAHYLQVRAIYIDRARTEDTQNKEKSNEKTG